MKFPPEAQDPFSMVYNGLWTLVERNQMLKEHIPPMNRIKYGNETLPKEENTESDTPELTLLLTGGAHDLMSTCSTASFKKSYAWALATGDLENERFHWMEFELIRCLADWETTLCPLMWKNCPFVQNLIFTGAEIGTMMREFNKNVEGWACLLSLDVQMSFSLVNLRLPPLP
jgi:hypothetical protein